MTTDVAVERAYQDYLKHQIKPFSKYTDLIEAMHDKEFVWIVPNDDNRIADALDFRADWADENGVELDMGSASFFEVLLGISRHLEFLTDEGRKGWAWQLVVNLGLDGYKNRLLSKGEREVEEILDACIWRTYKPNGRGGFFPLLHPDQDQREVEIWYQMQHYVGELTHS